jgi:general secretion pathway protein G
MLVVLAIIALLTSLILPAVGKVRMKAKLTGSMNNARQLVVATNLYAQEHQSKFPVWHDYIKGIYWWEEIAEYYNEDQSLLKSPAHREFDGSTRDSIAETISYGWNYEVMGRHRGDNSFSADHVLNAMTLSPNKTLVLTDSTRESSWGYINHIDHYADPERYGNDSAVAAFLDGRVTTLPVTDLRQQSPYFIPTRLLPDTI